MIMHFRTIFPYCQTVVIVPGIKGYVNLKINVPKTVIFTDVAPFGFPLKKEYRTTPPRISSVRQRKALKDAEAAVCLP